MNSLHPHYLHLWETDTLLHSRQVKTLTSIYLGIIRNSKKSSYVTHKLYISVTIRHSIKIQILSLFIFFSIMSTGEIVLTQSRASLAVSQGKEVISTYRVKSSGIPDNVYCYQENLQTNNMLLIYGTSKMTFLVTIHSVRVNLGDHSLSHSAAWRLKMLQFTTSNRRTVFHS